MTALALPVSVGEGLNDWFPRTSKQAGIGSNWPVSDFAKRARPISLDNYVDPTGSDGNALDRECSKDKCIITALHVMADDRACALRTSAYCSRCS